MSKKVFLSFRGEDQFKVNTLRGLAQFKNISFEMDDVSLRNAIDSKDEAYIKSVIRPKIRSCDVCLCLVGENTHRSRKWVPWEIRLALEENKSIIAMRFYDSANAQTPAILVNNIIRPFNWDIDKLVGKVK